MKFKLLFSFITISSLMLAISACDDAPAGPPPFQEREMITEQDILGKWEGTVRWGGGDSITDIELEALIIEDLVPIKIEDPESPGDSLEIIDTVIFYTVNIDYYDKNQGDWVPSSGQWFIGETENVAYFVFGPPPTGNTLYTGYLSADSLYGPISFAFGGYQGDWSVRRKQPLDSQE